MRRILLLVFILIFNISLVNSQSLKASIGVGLPDLFHAQVSTTVSNKNEVGLQLGTFFADDLSLSLTAEHRLFLSMSKKFQNVNTWFFSQRATYLLEKSDLYRWGTWFVSLSIGKNVYWTPKFGLSFDLGLSAIVFEEQFNISDGSRVDNDSPAKLPEFFPNLRLQMFYRI